MLRILIMCLLGLSGIFLGTFGAETSPVTVTPLADMGSGSNGAEEMTAKTKRHGVYPCSQSHLSYGAYLPQTASYSGHYQAQAYQKPIVIPSYQHVIPKVEIGYQKPIAPKTIYQVIQKPVVHHAAYNVQPVAKQQVQYIQQPIYAPVVKQQPISYVKSVAPTVSYNNVQKSIDGYVNKFSYDFGGHHIGSTALVQNSNAMHMQSYYPKQYLKPISYYSKPAVSQSMPFYYSSANYMNKYAGYSGADFIHQSKPNLISVKQPIADCEKPHQPQVSYVKLSQPVVQHVHQPMLQYAAKYQQPMIQYAAKYQQPMVHFVQKVQQPVYHFAPKFQQQPTVNYAAKIHHQPIVQQPIVDIAPKLIHQPIAQNFFFKYAQPMIAYGHEAQHSLSVVAPSAVHHSRVNYQSHIVGEKQPCHK